MMARCNEKMLDQTLYATRSRPQGDRWVGLNCPGFGCWSVPQVWFWFCDQ